MSIHLTIRIENHYEEIDTVVVTQEITVGLPPEGDYQDDGWAYDEVYPYTGTGHTTGDSAYFVEVIASSDPDLIPVGTEWEWGT